MTLDRILLLQRQFFGRSERTLSLIHAAAEQKRKAGGRWDRVEGRIERVLSS